MIMNIFLLVTAGALLLLGLIGAVVPVLPGAPLGWLGLLVGSFSTYCNIPTWMLIVTFVISILVTVLDSIFPVTMTKKAGGSKWGSWGSTIGLILGFFAGPIGIIICPFLGALVGELIHDSSDFRRALKAAFGAFKGFLAGTGLKLITCAGFIWAFVWWLLKGIGA